MNDARKQIVKYIRDLSHRHSAWNVFSDFVEAAAISLSNAVDLAQAPEREARYLEIVKRYTKEEFAAFPAMLSLLTAALEDEPGDVLGVVFHELELQNKYVGQFFTPYELCRAIARMTIDADQMRQQIEERGFITCAEPAAGAGAMLVAFAQEMRDAGFNYQRHLHVTAVDVDLKTVHMCYLQLALLHVPAIVIHGNSLSLETRGVWYTPAHILGGWNWKLRARRAEQPTETKAVHPPSSTPQQMALFAEGAAA